MKTRIILLTIVLFVLHGGVGLALAQAVSLAPEKGLLLVAREKLPDPRFRDSVILLLQHNDQGSVGLIVNRTSRLPLSSVLISDHDFSGAGQTLSYGGPIEPETLLTLVRVKQSPPEPSEQIADGLYLAGIEGLAQWQEKSSQKQLYRVFTGYAGWAAGQLEKELVQKDWKVVVADADSLFGEDIPKLWQQLRID